MDANGLPPALAEIRDEFLELDLADRLQLLLEYANDLPELPERYSSHPDLMERVEECQSPVYIFVEADPETGVHLFATAPREAPTTRGFVSILRHALDGMSPQEVLDVPDEFPQVLGLSQAVSPLRIRGMTAMLGRTKRQVRERVGSADEPL